VVVVHPGDSGLRVAVSGDIDFWECQRFVRKVTSRLVPGADAMVLTLDMGGVTFCDSAGLAALIQIRQACDTAGWTFVLSAVVPSVRRVLDLTDLSAWFSLPSPRRSRG
jgi:anti-anti-sigma factor